MQHGNKIHNPRGPAPPLTPPTHCFWGRGRGWRSQGGAGAGRKGGERCLRNCPQHKQLEPASRHMDITTKGAPGAGPHRDKASRNPTRVQLAGHSCLRSGTLLTADSRNLTPHFLLQALLLEVARWGDGAPGSTRARQGGALAAHRPEFKSPLCHRPGRTMVSVWLGAGGGVASKG